MQEPLLGRGSNKPANNNDNETTSLITSRDLDPEEAETHNVARLDSESSNRSHLSQSDQQYEDIHNLLAESGDDDADDANKAAATSSPPPRAPPRKGAMAAPSFKNVARRVILMQKLQQQQSIRLHNKANKNTTMNTTTTSSNTSNNNKLIKRHRKNATSTAAELLDQIRDVNYTTAEASSSEDPPPFPFEQGSPVHSSTIFHSAGLAVSSSSSSSLDEGSTRDNDEAENEKDRYRGDSLPVVAPDPHHDSKYYGSIPPTTTSTTTRAQPTGTSRSRMTHFFSRKLRRYTTKWCGSPLDLATHLWEVLYRSYFLRLAIPLFVAAWFLYYCLANPPWNFIPGTARSAWLLNFLGRQVVTLELARMTQWVLLDCLLLGSRTLAHTLGPFVTMTAVQSKGAPFVMACWAGWDMLILQGEGEFQSHWLFWTGIRLYSTVASRSGEYILTSDLYLRFLLSMILAGIVTTAKRMLLTVRFGRRTLVDFKPTMEKLLADMVLVSEIADLAEEASKLQEDEIEIDERPSGKEFIANIPRKTMPSKGLWSSVKFEDQKASSDDGDGDGEEEEVEEEKQSPEVSSPKISDNVNRKSDRPHLPRSPSGSILFKSRLEKWDEPSSKLDKGEQVTIQDVLKFKHALNYMDDEYPFGKSFGKASDRNESIDCSHSIYYKLLKCSPESYDLPFEVISWITFDEKGFPDGSKLKALRRLFHPDVRGNLPLLAFIQSCDSVYKRFRYFKASVSNASVIDYELERMVNCFFWLLLIMMVLLMMRIDPWPILVSMTSLLVSVSFALGPSLSKYVEGILLIAVRRPFDLGDRILINSTESSDSPGGPMGWFVEDITLSSTTLRFSKSNEVATVSNFAMSQSKIVNCQRSPSAVVFFNLKVHRKIFEGNNLETLNDELQKYVQNNPRTWESLLFIRQDFIGGVSVTPGTVWSQNMLDADYQFVILSLCFQHRLGWQSSARIMITRGELMRHIYDICLRLGVQYDNPDPRRVTVQNINGSPDPSTGAGQQQPNSPFSQAVSGQISGGVDESNLF